MMTKRRARLCFLTAPLFALFASSALCRAEDGLRLRAIDPKPFYKPGDRIEFELRCLGAVTEVPVVLYNPSLDRIDSGAFVPDLPKCPSSRFQIDIPRDFIGKNRVTAQIQRGERRYADIFEFEVRSDARPSDLQLGLSPDWQIEGCHLSIFREGPAPPDIDIDLFSVMGDGTRFDLCKEGKVKVATEPAGNGVFAMEDGHCYLTAKKPGTFKVVASYRGLRKEMTCTVDAYDTPLDTVTPTPRPTTLSATKISVDQFLADPARLDRHPVEIGRCRTVEHWDTGYCYVFSERRGKVSQDTDDRCDNLTGLRDRMLKAIRQGFCDSRAPDSALAGSRTPYTPPEVPVSPMVYSIPEPGAHGSPPRISIQAFRNDPRKLDRHPMDVGKCRLVEHHRTGYCYVYSFPDSQKVSELTDARCAELDELRRRMRIAIDEGYCGIPAKSSGITAAPRGVNLPQLKKTMSDMRMLAISVEAYRVDHNSYPVVPDVPALAKLVEPMYIGRALLTDGWGTPFEYVSDGKQYRIVSAGADRSFEPDSAKLDKTPDGETDSLARDLIYSNGTFLQWPKQGAR